MTDDGKLGFGHLRYQEYLTALLLKEDRNIHIASYATQPWWHGVFSLLAQMLEVDWLIQDLALEDMLGACRDTIDVIINSSPKDERALLREIVDRHIQIEKEDYSAVIGPEEPPDEVELDSAQAIWKL